jgi:hypothetical protein
MPVALQVLMVAFVLVLALVLPQLVGPWPVKVLPGSALYAVLGAWTVGATLFALTVAVTSLLLGVSSERSERAVLLADYRRTAFTWIFCASMLVIVAMGVIAWRIERITSVSPSLVAARELDSAGLLLLLEVAALGWLVFYVQRLLELRRSDRLRSARRALDAFVRWYGIEWASQGTADAWGARLAVEFADYMSGDAAVKATRAGEVYDLYLARLGRAIGSARQAADKALKREARASLQGPTASGGATDHGSEQSRLGIDTTLCAKIGADLAAGTNLADVSVHGNGVFTVLIRVSRGKARELGIAQGPPRPWHDIASRIKQVAGRISSEGLTTLRHPRKDPAGLRQATQHLGRDLARTARKALAVWDRPTATAALPPAAMRRVLNDSIRHQAGRIERAVKLKESRPPTEFRQALSAMLDIAVSSSLEGRPRTLETTLDDLSGLYARACMQCKALEAAKIRPPETPLDEELAWPVLTEFQETLTALIGEASASPSRGIRLMMAGVGLELVRSARRQGPAEAVLAAYPLWNSVVEQLGPDNGIASSEAHLQGDAADLAHALGQATSAAQVELLGKQVRCLLAVSQTLLNQLPSAADTSPVFDALQQLANTPPVLAANSDEAVRQAIAELSTNISGWISQHKQPE